MLKTKLRNSGFSLNRIAFLAFAISQIWVLGQAHAQEKVPAIQPMMPVEAEDWKGSAPLQKFSASALGGLGIVKGEMCLGLNFAAAYQMSPEGFIPDINDPASLEFQIGPFIRGGDDALNLSFHLRWDFIRNAEWTVFSMSGLGIQKTGVDLGDDMVVFPRFGAGAFYSLNSLLSLRVDVSHELTGLGVTAFF